MKNKKIVLLIVLLLVCVLSLTACGEASLADLQEEATASLDTALATYTESDYTADNYALITAAYDTALAGINAVTDKANLPGSFVDTFVATADEVVTIAEQEVADTAAALAAAKTSAIALLDAELAKYSSTDYSTDNYAIITDVYDTALDGINAVTDIANLPGEFVEDFVAIASITITLAEQEASDAAQLASKKVIAINALDTALANYDSTNYTTDNYATITSAYDTAKAGIEAVTDIANLPGEFVSTFTTAAEEVVTIAEQAEIDAAALAAAKASAIESLDTALAKYDSADYTTATYAVITNAYNTVLANINAVTDVTKLPGEFVATFTATADRVVTIAEQEAADAEALAAKIATELALLDTALETYVSEDYTVDNYATITTAYATAKAGIEAVTDIADLPGYFLSTFEATANDVETIAGALAAAKASAIEALDTELSNYVSADYTTGNYATITSAYDTAKAGIEAVTDVANLPGEFVSTFATAAEEVLTIAEQAEIDAAALAAAKASAIESLDTALATYTESNYTADSYALITAAYGTAKAGIEAVTDAANLPGEFVATFTDYADRVLTEAEQAAADAAALAAKIAAELAVLDTALATYTESSYTVDNYETITAAYATAKAGIEAVTDIANLPGTFVSTFTTAASAVVTIAQQTAADLADKQAEVIADLDTALATYSESNYSATNYALITSAYATAKSGINGVTDIADLPGDFVSTFTTAADAVDDIYVDFSFAPNGDGTYSVSAYTGTAADVVVPSTYEGGAVTGIAAATAAASGVFYYNTNIVSVILPDSITSIGAYAFYYCTSLTSINLPDSITSIGAYAFYYCTSLTSINLPDGITSIGQYAFSECSSIGSITLPAELTDISNRVFYNCTSLGGTLIIPSKVVSIGSYPFSNSKIEVFYIPSSLQEVSSAAFYGCETVTNVYYGGSTIYEWLEIEFSAQTCTPFYYANGESFYLLVSGTYGGIDAVYAEVTSLELDTTNLNTTCYGLAGLDSLCSVVITGGDTIPGYMFAYCIGLESLSIPSSITNISSWAFSGCTTTNIYYGGATIYEWLGIVFAASSASPCFAGDNNHLYFLSSGVYGSVDAVYTEVTSLEIDLDKLPTAATSKCYGLYGLNNLTTVVIIGGSTIPSFMFNNCTGLESVTIPSSVTTISSNAFLNCSAIIEVYYGGTVEMWFSLSSLSTKTQNPLYYSAYAGNAITLYLYDSQEGEYYAPTTIDLSDSDITSIAEYSFMGISNVTNFIMPDTVTTIGTYAFYGSALQSITLSSKLTTINSYAFQYCTSLQSIALPSSLTSIGSYAFRYCYSLTEFVMSEASTKYSTLDGVLFSADGATLLVYPVSKSDAEYTIPSGVTEISAYAFASSAYLQTVVISADVATIGTYAFIYSSNLVTVEFEEGINLTALPSQIFSACTSLEYITMPDSLKSIGTYAFYGCESLAVIDIPSSITSLTSNSFAYCTSLEAVIITENTTTINSLTFSGSNNVVLYLYGTSISSSWHIGDITVIVLGTAVESGDFEYSVTNGTATITNYTGSDSLVVVPSTIDGYTVTAILGAFENNTTITSVTISEGVTSIGANSFNGCTNLSSVILPSTLTTIGNYAFADCYSLYELVLPDNIQSIGYSFVSVYHLDIDSRSGMTVVVSSAQTMMVVLGTNLFHSSNSPENTLQLGADIYFESGMNTMYTSELSGFMGTIDGTEAMFSLNNLDLLSQSCLIYYAGNSTFTNLIINVGQNGGALVIYAYGDSIIFDNIETYGDVYLAGGTANYSPIFAMSIGSTVYFRDVTTYVNITALGNSYFSNFLGGYSTNTVTFENCINHGNLIGDNPSVFIGNSFGMGSVSVVILETVYNRGNVVGYTNSAYFGAVGDAGDSYHAEQVAAIESNSLNIVPVVSDGSITVTTGEDGTITISDSGDDATQYLVTYTAWASLTGITGGSRCISISYLVTAADMASTGLPTTVLMTTTLHEGITFVADNTSSATASAMMYQYEGVWYLYVDTSELTGISANCSLVNKSVTATVMGLDDNLNVVTVQQ